MSPLGSSPSPLTPEQRAILECVAAGLGTHAIGRALGWDADAVLLHLAGAIGALRASSVPDAVARAVDLGLIEAPESSPERRAG